MSELSSIGDIGATLKAVREERGINISSAAMQTNLSSTIITKLEANEFQNIGAPVFTRGYLTQYVRFLGLDIKAFTEAYNALGLENSEIRINAANIAGQSASFKRHHFGAWLLVVPLLIVAGVIALQVTNGDSWLMTQFRHAFLETGRTQTSDLVDNNHQIILQVGDDATASEQPSTNNTAISGQVVGGTQLPTLTSLESLDNTNDEPTVPAVDNTVTSGAPMPQLSTEVQQVDDKTTPIQTANTNNSANKLEMLNENWVEVRDKANKIVSSRIFKKGETIDLPINGAPYSLNIGRPNDVKLILNGNETALKPLAVKGSARKFKIEITQ